MAPRSGPKPGLFCDMQQDVIEKVYFEAISNSLGGRGSKNVKDKTARA